MPRPYLVAWGGYGSPTSGTAFNLPPHLENDLVVFTVAARQAANLGGTSLTGFTKLYDHSNGTASHQVFYRVALADNEANPTITHTFTSSFECAAVVIRGADPADPIDTSTSANQASSATWTLPTVTTDAANDGLLHIASTGNTITWSSWSMGDSTLKIADVPGSSLGMGLAWSHVAAVGAVSAGSVTPSATAGGSVATIAIHADTGTAPDQYAPDVADFTVGTPVPFTSTSNVIVLPATAEGDLILLCVGGREGADKATTPAGYRRLLNFGESNVWSADVLWKVAGASEPNPTITHSFSGAKNICVPVVVAGAPSIRGVSFDAAMTAADPSVSAFTVENFGAAVLMSLVSASSNVSVAGTSWSGAGAGTEQLDVTGGSLGMDAFTVSSYLLSTTDNTPGTLSVDYSAAPSPPDGIWLAIATDIEPGIPDDPGIPDGEGVGVGDATVAPEIGLGSGPVEGSPTWDGDLSEYMYGLSITRGRSGPLQRFETGTAVIRLNNDDGRFDPGNEDSPYWPNLRLRAPVRIRMAYDGITYTIFRGMVESWPIVYGQTAFTSWVDLPLVDMSALLFRRNFAEQEWAAGRTDQRITAILDAVGWDADLRDLDVGVADVPAETLGGNALDLIYRAADAEAGFFYVAADGKATFRNRTSLAGGASSSATFADDGTGLVYSDPQFAFDDDTLFTQVTATRDGGVAQIAEDATAVGLYDRINLPVSGSFVNDNGALNVAEWLVLRHKDVQRRVTSIEVEPLYDEANLWPEVLSLELRDAVTVKFTPPGGGTAVDQVCAIERIEHRMEGFGPWQTTYGLHPLADIETKTFFTLDQSLLDGDDVLA